MGNSGIRELGNSGTWDFGNSGILELGISGILEFGNLGFRELGISGISGFREFWKFGTRGFWISGIREVWDLGILLVFNNLYKQRHGYYSMPLFIIVYLFLDFYILSSIVRVMVSPRFWALSRRSIRRLKWRTGCFMQPQMMRSPMMMLPSFRLCTPLPILIIGQ